MWTCNRITLIQPQIIDGGARGCHWMRDALEKRYTSREVEENSEQCLQRFPNQRKFSCRSTHLGILVHQQLCESVTGTNEHSVANKITQRFRHFNWAACVYWVVPCKHCSGVFWTETMFSVIWFTTNRSNKSNFNPLVLVVELRKVKWKRWLHLDDLLSSNPSRRVQHVQKRLTLANVSCRLSSLTLGGLWIADFVEGRSWIFFHSSSEDCGKNTLCVCVRTESFIKKAKAIYPWKTCLLKCRTGRLVCG